SFAFNNPRERQPGTAVPGCRSAGLPQRRAALKNAEPPFRVTPQIFISNGNDPALPLGSMRIA
ncbi:MAG: hypothetical protein RSD95_16100, partial [Clostridia bacterium]